MLLSPKMMIKKTKMEHLYLKNFGPIKEMDIDLKPLMVFIGESGSGKSAILKLLSLLRWVHKQNNLRTYFVKSSIAKKKSDYNRLNSNSLLKISGLDELIRKDTEISFQIGDTLYESKGKILTDTKLNGELTLDKIAFISENRGVLPDIYANKIPRNFKLPYYLQDTYDNFLIAFEQLDKKEFSIESTNLILFQKKGILPQFFIKDKGNTFEMKLENSSSGTKTAVFPEIIVSYLTQQYNFKDVLAGGFNDFLMSKIQQMQQLGKIEAPNINLANFSSRNLSIFIEEPELSLFPSAQRRLLNSLVRDCFAKNNQENCITNLAFATHSPYILTSLNNLLLAGEIGKDSDKKDVVHNIVSKEYWLTATQVGAYAIENGKVKYIIDENNLINAEYLDSVSEDIVTEFSNLLDIQYGNR